MANICVEQPLPLLDEAGFVIRVVHHEPVRYSNGEVVSCRATLSLDGKLVNGYSFENTDQAHACADGMSLALEALGFQSLIVNVDERG